MAWHSKEVIRSIYDIDDTDTATVFVAQLGIDLQDDSCPPEVQPLGRTIVRWQSQIAAWHRCHHTNRPTEAINNLVKRVKRIAFEMTNLNRPEFVGGSWPWKRGWSYVEQEVTGEAVDASVYAGGEGASCPVGTPSA